MSSPNSKSNLLKELSRYERQNHELRLELQSCSQDLKDAERLNSHLSREIEVLQDNSIDEDLARCLSIVADILEQPCEPSLDRRNASCMLVSKLEVVRSRYNRLQSKLTEQQELMRRTARESGSQSISGQNSAERFYGVKSSIKPSNEMHTPSKSMILDRGDTDKPTRTRTVSQKFRVQISEEDSVLNRTISFGRKKSPLREFKPVNPEETKKEEPKPQWTSLGSSQSPKGKKRSLVTRDIGQYLERFTRLKASTLNFSTLRTRN
mmetsp:Transcript_27426/g.49412  ORF Transcript_27426/g.49412 Transcript_27426/m.49412 type:complete len:265 (-) Transcript_27426:1711-2505(-)